jgi:hypothetical protein
MVKYICKICGEMLKDDLKYLSLDTISTVSSLICLSGHSCFKKTTDENNYTFDFNEKKNEIIIYKKTE